MPSRDRSRVAAWELGSVLGPPGIGEADFTPVAATYFWSHPDEDRLFRAVLIGVFNEVFWARSPAGWGELEVDLTWENFNVPVAQPEVIDGETLDAESVERGYLRPGLGIGWRRQIDPGYNDNMLLVRLAAEPSYVYFDDDPAETAGDFRVPQDGMELRAHLQVRLDAVERNLLELPHSGFLLGGDVIYGYRPSQEDWGPGGRRNAGDGRNWVSATAYLLGAGPVPFVQSERHRLVGSLHAGVGAGLDRFSAPRLGGGPDARGEEWDSTARVIVPGAAIDEFFPRHYAVLAAEYRFEPIFFTYVGVRGALAWLDRDRRRGSRLRSSDSLLPSIGARITTGFFFETRLRIDYDYNFGVVRHGEFGGHGVVVEVAGEF